MARATQAYKRRARKNSKRYAAEYRAKADQAERSPVTTQVFKDAGTAYGAYALGKRVKRISDRSGVSAAMYNKRKATTSRVRPHVVGAGHFVGNHKKGIAATAAGVAVVGGASYAYKRRKQRNNAPTYKRRLKSGKIVVVRKGKKR